MIFFLDENFPKAAHSMLTNLGHQVIDSREEGFEGSTDEFLLGEAISREAIFLTTDRDFFHTLQYHYTEHHGIVVIALSKPNRQAILDRLEWLLREIKTEHFKSRAFQLREQTWKAHPPLDS